MRWSFRTNKVKIYHVFNFKKIKLFIDGHFLYFIGLLDIYTFHLQNPPICFNKTYFWVLGITRFWDALGPKTASSSLIVSMSKARIFKQTTEATVNIPDDVIQFCPMALIPMGFQTTTSGTDHRCSTNWATKPNNIHCWLSADLSWLFYRRGASFPLSF